VKEEVLPLWVHRIDTLRIGFRSNVWLQARGRPIRGWLLQQLVKLAVAPHLTADVIVHADSDVVLLRPFSTSSVVDEHGRTRLYSDPDHIDERLPNHILWHRSAEKLLGIAPRAVPLPNFISSLVPWSRANAIALLEHIERNTGSTWLRAVSGAWHVSEHTLYGRFAQDVLGADAGGFVPSPSLCQDYYKRVPLSAREVEALLDRLSPQEFAVSLTAKGGMRPADYVEVLERRWAALGTDEPARDDGRAERKAGQATDGPERVREAPSADSQGRTGAAGRTEDCPPDATGRRRGAASAARGYAVVCAASVFALVVALLMFVD
jgi:hypothetical protein